MKLKTVVIDGKTYAEVNADNNPLYIHDDGTESAHDAVHSLGTIKRLNSEAKQHREAFEAERDKLKLFADIDPAKAKEALGVVANLDQQKHADASEREKEKEVMAKSFRDAYEPQIAEWKDKYDNLVSTYQNKDLETKFSQSEYIKQNISTHPSVMFNNFKGSFDFDKDGNLFAKDQYGQAIYSKADPSRYADFDEGFSVVVSGCSYKDTFMKGSQSQGGGYSGGQQNKAGQKSMPREQFEKLTPAEKSGFIRDKGTVTE